jgi:4-amino-4-deoxy-L-arabinose transferase-like glycosyltransferase
VIELPSAQQSVEIKKVTRNRSLANMTLSRWSLPLILAFQSLFSWMLLQNTAFQDEGLYVYAGRQILQNWLWGQPLYDRYSYYFSGYPYVYPVIAGALDLLGGLELTRAFSLVCMLIVTACGYYVTRRLFNQKSAIFAALFLVCQGPVLFLGRLATYDPLCLCFLAVATALAVKAGQARRPWLALSIGPFLLLAFGAKYVALIFMPSIFAILALCALLKWGWISMLVRGSLAVFSLAVVAALAATLVIRFDPNMLHALGATTTDRLVIQVYSRSGLAIHVIEFVGLSYLVGLIVLAFMRKNQVLLVLLFFGSSLLIPTYHIYKAELVSLEKHLGFSMFFLMPLAGYALASLSGFQRRFSPGRYWLSGVAICLLLFLMGTRVAQEMYAKWAPTDRLAYVFSTQVRSAGGRYLAEQFEVSRYNLRAMTYNWQWVGLDFFEYKDKEGRYYLGNDAYVKAIQDGYFDLIQLNYGYNIQTAILVEETLEKSKKYELIDKIPYRNYYESGYFRVWRKQ